jgi:transposase InsO family protein
MGTRRKVSAEYKREAVAMPDAPGVSVSRLWPNGALSDVLGRWQRPAWTPVILHSDRCQFTSDEYQRFLEAHQVICSMSAVGACRQRRGRELLWRAQT